MINKKYLIFGLILVASVIFLVAGDSQQNNLTLESNATIEVVVPQVHACACGPTEHWFHKACVKNYNKHFPQAGLPENFDTEGLSANVLQAIEMLAQDISFIAQDGTAIVPELNAKGKLILKMLNNPDYVLCKQILKLVDLQTTLTAQELYQQWSDSLHAMKSAQ
jgi:hypothetical protein